MCHPSSFPESLVEDHILTWSNIGDIVLDPMVGGGTTSKMSKKNNRKFIGIDRIEEYINTANKRLDIIPYNEENQNPKIKFIETREEIIKRRKKSRNENKNEKN